MPVTRQLSATSRPPWSAVTSAGVFRVAREGRFDCHYHDCHEYWLIFKGKAKIMTEGQAFYVAPGDIVCTRAGDEHDVVEVYEDLEAFWFEEATPSGGRVGHLHRDPAKANGHPVPGRPLPADCPV